MRPAPKPDELGGGGRGRGGGGGGGATPPYVRPAPKPDELLGVFGRFDLAALGGCHTLNVCYVML